MFGTLEEDVKNTTRLYMFSCVITKSHWPLDELEQESLPYSYSRFAVSGSLAPGI